MADLPAEHQTLRDLLREPGMSIGIGLVALGCAGLLFAICYLWMMPPSHLEAAIAAQKAAKPALVEQRLPDPATIAPAPVAIAPPAAEPLVVERAAALPETPPGPVQADAATAEPAMVAEADSMAAMPSAAAPVDAAPVATAPVTAPIAAPPPSAQAMAAPAPKAADAAAPAAKAAPPPAVAKGYRLQLGAMRTPESAQQEWDRLQQQNGDVLGKLAYAAPRADLGKRGVFYRIQAGPIAAAGDANRVCTALKQRGVSCILVKP